MSHTYPTHINTYQTHLPTSCLAMFIFHMLSLLSVGSVTIAKAGVVRIDTIEKVVDVVGEEVIQLDNSEHEDEICKSYERVIAPKIAQNISGQLKFISQDNSSHSDLQPVSISLCSSPGSSCSGCLPPGMDHQHIPDKVCQQGYREVKMFVIGDNGRDLVKDTFLMPDGCKCVSR